MQVILKKDVQNLGEAGELVNVKDGYARNFLIPKNFAEVATEGALKNREQNLARIQAKQEKLHQEALAKAAEIEKLGQIELSAKAGESGKLFGTITTKKLCEELKEKANIEVDRKTVSLNAPINKIGEFTMLIKLTSKVRTELKVVVTASDAWGNDSPKLFLQILSELVDKPQYSKYVIWDEEPGVYIIFIDKIDDLYNIKIAFSEFCHDELFADTIADILKFEGVEFLLDSAMENDL